MQSDNCGSRTPFEAPAMLKSSSPSIARLSGPTSAGATTSSAPFAISSRGELRRLGHLDRDKAEWLLAAVQDRRPVARAPRFGSTAFGGTVVGRAALAETVRKLAKAGPQPK